MTSHQCYKKMTLNETLFEDLLYFLRCFGKKKKLTFVYQFLIQYQEPLKQKKEKFEENLQETMS